MSSVTKDNVQTIGKDIYTVSGYFAISAGSAVGTAVPAAGLVGTWTKPAGTGVYRFTFNTNAQPNDVFGFHLSYVVAAGTSDRTWDPVAKHTGTNGFVDYIEIQSRKKSDGSAVDPVSMDVYYTLVCKDSSLRP